MASRLFAILSLLLVMLIWGTAYVATKAALVEVPPFLLALLRFGIASAILIAIAQRQGGLARLPRPLPLASLALLGLTGVTFFFAGYNTGLLYTTASNGALISGAIPALTAALAVVTLGERPTRGRLLGIAGSVLGVSLIVIAGAHDAEAADPLLGNLLIFASSLAWAIYTILGKRMEHLPQTAVTAYSGLLGTLFLLPPVAYELAITPPPPFSTAAWLAVLYLGVAPSALCYLLWNRALLFLDASQVANFINLIPVIGVASAVLLLGETVQVVQLLGGALVLAGVWLSSRPSTDGV